MKIFSATTLVSMPARYVIDRPYESLPTLPAGSRVSAILVDNIRGMEVYHVNGDLNGETVERRISGDLLSLGPAIAAINEGGAARG